MGLTLQHAVTDMLMLTATICAGVSVLQAQQLATSDSWGFAPCICGATAYTVLSLDTLHYWYVAQTFVVSCRMNVLA